MGDETANFYLKTTFNLLPTRHFTNKAASNVLDLCLLGRCGLRSL
jgi:hypothetical protein